MVRVQDFDQIEVVVEMNSDLGMTGLSHFQATFDKEFIT